MIIIKQLITFIENTEVKFEEDAVSPPSSPTLVSQVVKSFPHRTFQLFHHHPPSSTLHHHPPGNSSPVLNQTLT